MRGVLAGPMLLRNNAGAFSAMGKTHLASLCGDTCASRGVTRVMKSTSSLRDSGAVKVDYSIEKFWYVISRFAVEGRETVPTA